MRNSIRSLAGLAGLILLLGLTPASAQVSQTIVATSNGNSLQSAAGANGNGTALIINGYGTVVFNVTGSFTATVNFERSPDNGTTWYAFPNVADGAIPSSSPLTATAAGAYKGDILGYTQVRARISGWSSGTVTVTANLAGATSTPLFINTAGTGASTNITQFGSSPVALGQTTMASSMPVVLASNHSNVPTNTVQINGAAIATAASGVQKVGITGNTGAAVDAAGQNVASPANELLAGLQFNTTPTTIVSGNMSPLQGDNAGNLLTDMMKVGGTAVTLGQAAMASSFPVVISSNQSNLPTNTAQVNGAAVSTSAPGVQKVGIVGNAGAAFDGATGAAVPANALQLGASDNTNLQALTVASAANQSAAVTGNKTLIATGPGTWTINNVPATATQATVTKAAGGAGVRHVCTSITACLADGANASTPVQVYLRDGASGAGTILWAGTVAAPVNGSGVITISGLNIFGSAATAMTVEFSAAGAAASQETVTATAYDAQ